MPPEEAVAAEALPAIWGGTETAMAAATVPTAAGVAEAAGASAALTASQWTGAEAAMANASAAGTAGTGAGVAGFAKGVATNAAGAAAGSLVSGAIAPRPRIGAMPALSAPTVMPSPTDANALATKRKSIAEQMRRMGRASTILTDQSDSLGGGR